MDRRCIMVDDHSTFHQEPKPPRIFWSKGPSAFCAGTPSQDHRGTARGTPAQNGIARTVERYCQNGIDRSLLPIDAHSMNMEFPREIETARMTLRKLAQADAEALFKAYKDPDHLRYMTFHPHRSLTDTRHYIEDSMQRWDAGDRKEYAILWKATNEVIGSTGAYLARGRASLGIVVAPRWTGKRIAIEATKGMIGFLQTLPGIFRMWAFCESSHEASRTVLRRIGFQEEGIVHAWACFPGLGAAARDCRFFYFPKNQPIAPEPDLQPA